MSAPHSPEEVRERLEEAADALRRLAIRVGPRGIRSSWPDIVREAAAEFALAVQRGGRYRDMEAQPIPPSAKEIDRMDEALAWLGYLDPRGRKVVWARVNGAPWWRIAQRYRKSERTVQLWFKGALTRICAGLNKPAQTQRRDAG